jgi:hypothetical protein
LFLWDYVHEINNNFDCAEESAMLKQLHAHKTQNPLESGMNEGDENVRPILLSYFWCITFTCYIIICNSYPSLHLSLIQSIVFFTAETQNQERSDGGNYLKEQIF